MNDPIMDSVLLGASRVVGAVHVLDPIYIGFVSVIDCHFTPNLRPIANSHVGE